MGAQKKKSPIYRVVAVCRARTGWGCAKKIRKKLCGQDAVWEAVWTDGEREGRCARHKPTRKERIGKPR